MVVVKEVMDNFFVQVRDTTPVLSKLNKREVKNLAKQNTLRMTVE